MDLARRLSQKIRRRSQQISPSALEQVNEKQQPLHDIRGIPNPYSKFPRPIQEVKYPKIDDNDQHLLVDQGWSPITFPTDDDPVRQSFLNLFRASKTFFALPEEEKRKCGTTFGSEEGWSKVEGEKEMITLRTIDNTPEELKDAAAQCWHIAGRYVNELLKGVEKSLNMSEDALCQFSLPCLDLDTNRKATMLRLFRYEVHESKVVAEPHNDLGLLSLVMSDTPGLEVWNRVTQGWIDLERQCGKPIVMSGRQLQRLSNERYGTGGHLVRSYGPQAWTQTRNPLAIDGVSSPRYRYSIVFILRAHGTVQVNTDLLETDVTGKFQRPIKDMSARDLFLAIKKNHYNINANQTDRNEQKKGIEAKKQQEAVGNGDGHSNGLTNGSANGNVNDQPNDTVALPSYTSTANENS